MTLEIERRLSPRLPAVPNRALALLKGPRIVPGVVIDISRSGALLRMDEQPKPNAKVWIGLTHPVTTRWIVGTVVRIGETGEVGINLLHACNPAFFWTATRGEVFRLLNS